MKNNIDEMSLEDFVDYMTRIAHDGLLQRGSVGLRQAIFNTVWLGIRRHECQKNRKSQVAKKAPR